MGFSLLHESPRWRDDPQTWSMAGGLSSLELFFWHFWLSQYPNILKCPYLYYWLKKTLLMIRLFSFDLLLVSDLLHYCWHSWYACSGHYEWDFLKTYKSFCQFGYFLDHSKTILLSETGGWSCIRSQILDLWLMKNLTEVQNINIFYPVLEGDLEIQSGLY